MGKNRAISIGINQYEFSQSLKYAKRDAQLMRDFLVKEAGFDGVFLLSDDLPPDKGMSTRPSFTNLRRVLKTMFEKPSMEAGDNFWFFFSGHGMRHKGCDYLMACDSDPGDVEHTAISINYVTERLGRCGADNIVLILDACREGEGSKSGEGVGNQAAQVAREKGVITIFSCSPNELSYEIDDWHQGIFTKAILEGLGAQGKCATVERLNDYLSVRVSELIRHYKGDKFRQTPYIIAEPATKYHLILCPKYATLTDVASMKLDASLAENNKDFALAEQLWIRVLAASPNGDMDAIKALKRIGIAETQQGSVPDKQTSEIRAKTDHCPQPKPPHNTPINHDVPLNSECGVDYTKLQDLLTTGRWKDADKETSKIMLEVAGRTDNGWLRVEDINRFPSEDLRTIDQLWVKYSNGRFGFSVQKRIYQSLGGGREYDEKIWEAFGDRVGWRVNKKWLHLNELKFDTKAPKGQLPGREGTVGDWEWERDLLSRRDL
ncbi:MULTISPECIES: GUN4 domain-containing protein [unclassified Microcoleus]|uniref:GUN4 domain-containing protein n=1 Tax=unclassified Microcoleus TaxID=2642155 RepID=UPI0025DE822C|nr:MULTISPECIES: GUN4 domain-containing protein [unclassified Microcoleus]